jgi:hypothetical protein
MKRQDSKNLRMKTGVSRLWLGVAAVVGAATAYLGDPQRGGARREAAVRQVSNATKSITERAGRWRNVVSARLSRADEGRLPEQVTVPSDPGGTAKAKPLSRSAPQPAETRAETKKPEA